MIRPDVLVLGGGGTLGEAWLRSVLAGLEAESGWDLRRCDAFVGTSAGAIVAAVLAAGRRPEAAKGVAGEWERAAGDEAGVSAGPSDGLLSAARSRGCGTEALLLRRRGARVRIVAPDGATVDAIGPNLFDGRRRAQVEAAGHRQGRALASRAMTLPDHVRENKASWEIEAANYVEPARRNWATDEISWGIFGVRESDVGALPDVDGMDVVELGCGTAYLSAWLARRGARPTGVDITDNQLATARAMQAEHGLEFPLVQASAEDVPLTDACADLVISEYGASLWCAPEAWIAEAARLLRPGGWLVFLTNSVLVALTAPQSGPNTDRLVRPQREISPLRFEDDDGVEFHLAHGEWIALLARHGFTVTGLHELYAPDGAEPPREDWMTVGWAQRWPVEEIWTARLAKSAPHR